MAGLETLLNRPRPSAWQRFTAQPIAFLATALYARKSLIPAVPLANAVSVVCISDTHNSRPSLPNGDILVHAGDLTQSGSLQELQQALSWLRSQPHRTKIVVAGNHDLLLDPKCAATAARGREAQCELDQLDWTGLIYLENSETIVTCENGRRLRVYGSPLSPKHGNWAFQYPRSENVWTTLPDDLDVLITHGPPRAHLDLSHLGCIHLLKELWRVKPRLHIFGHIHAAAGKEWIAFDEVQKAFEQTVITRGVYDLLRMTVMYIRRSFLTEVESKSLLVNASMVGGLKDEIQRRAIKVKI